MASSQPAAKRHKTSGPLIGTHSGTFHADEALAVFLLRLLPTYASSPLVRTRDPEQLATCHTVVDVGSAYDASSHRYDHHQRGFSHFFPGHFTTLSSAGLVWLHFGRSVISARSGWPESDARTELIWRKLYADFVEAVDANDNGINAYGPDELKDGARPKFQERGFTLASIVADMNRELDEADLATPALAIVDSTTGAGSAASTGEKEIAAVDETSPQAKEDARFLKASVFMGQALLRKLAHAARVWLPAKDAVDTAYGMRHSVHPSGRIVRLDGGGVPWKEHLYTAEGAALATLEGDEGMRQQAEAKGVALENLGGVQVAVYYILYPENAESGAKWRVQCVPVSKESFESRRPLREEWRGVRDDELSAKSGIEGCVFCHASGFIGGNKTYEGALKMAERSLED